MFENQAKGWHGNFSTVGRNSVAKYHLILYKDLILQGRFKKKNIEPIFTRNKVKSKTQKKIDIFQESPIKTKIAKMKENSLNKKKICEPYNNKQIPDKYKYHQHHHKELYNYNMIIKKSKKYTHSSGNYNPKLDYIWKKTITGPTWDIISGREKKVIKLKDDDLIKDKKKEKNHNQNKINETDKNISNNNLTIESIKNNSSKTNKKNDINRNKRKNHSYNSQKIFGVSMIKQTKRGVLPIFYDLRIRYDKPFKKKENKKIAKAKINKNKLLNLLLHKKKTKEKKDSKIKTPKKKINNCLDFSKSISREQYENLFKEKELVPFSIQNYTQIEPRCLTMVSYTQKRSKRNMQNKLKGIDNTIFYNPDKIINKVNNHKEVSVPNFKIMVSRPDDKSPLPSYMINKFDRASLETITQKGLKMNGYTNVGFKTYSSSFYPKKSFNWIINYNLLNSDKFVNSNLDGLLEKLNKNRKFKKLFQLCPLETSHNFENNSPKFDAITFRTINNERKKITKLC